MEMEMEMEVEVEMEAEFIKLPDKKKQKVFGDRLEVGNMETWTKELNFEVGNLNNELSKIDKDLNKLLKKL